MIKDHLGNTRMLLNAEEQPQQSYPNCDFEDDHATENETYYLNAGPETYLITPPPGFSTSEGTGAKCQVIKNNDAPVGVGKLLKVMVTDEVGVKLDYYIPTAPVDNTGSNPMEHLIESIIAILNNTGYSGAMHGGGENAAHGINDDIALNSLLQSQGPSSPSNNVKAYLNILFFDEGFNFVCEQSQYVQLSVMGSTQTVTILGSSMIAAPANGYAYIYVSNESRNAVFIDNFQVLHRPGRIVQDVSYYPFGLVQAGISSSAANITPNKEKTFQGQRFDDDFGINYVQFKYRSHDPQIGRFIQIDPLADKYVHNSTYAFSENKVTGHVELEGLEAEWFMVRTWVSDFFVGAADFRDGSRTIAQTNQGDYHEQGIISEQMHAVQGSVQQASGMAQMVKPGLEAAEMVGNIATGLEIPESGVSLVSKAGYGIEKQGVVNLEQRAKEIHGVLSEYTQSKTTTAVASATTSEGNSVTLVASSENRLRPAQRAILQKGEIPVTGPGHAEQTILNHAATNGIQVSQIAASRPICPTCATAIQNSGAQPASLLKMLPSQAVADGSYLPKPLTIQK